MRIIEVCFLATYAQSKEGNVEQHKLKFEHVSRSLNFMFACCFLQLLQACRKSTQQVRYFSNHAYINIVLAVYMSCIIYQA